MSIVNVPCTYNSRSITATVNHVDGKALRINIAPNRALIDKNGYIRLFVITYDDGEEHAYLLQPHYVQTKTTVPVLNTISWGMALLAGYGLALISGKVVKKVVAEKNPTAGVIVDLASYIFHGQHVAPMIKSFTDDLFLETHVEFGYYNIRTEKLIWTQLIKVENW